MSDDAKKDRTSEATEVVEATVVPRWRVGRTLGRTIYYDDLLIGMVDTESAAKRIVEAASSEDDEHDLFCACAKCNAEHEEASRNDATGIMSAEEIANVRAKTLGSGLPGGSALYGEHITRLLDSHEALRNRSTDYPKRIEELESALRQIATYVNPDASDHDDFLSVQHIAEDALESAQKRGEGT